MGIALTEIADAGGPKGRSAMALSGQQTNRAEQRRRRRPGLFDADWWVLRGLSRD